MGAYVLKDHGSHEFAVSPNLCIAATGSEVQQAQEVAAALVAAKPSLFIRVVSFPCWELFERQTMEYQRSIFTDNTPVMSIEAGGVHGWQKYAHAPFGLTGFGMSAPLKQIQSHFGFTIENLTAKANEVMTFYTGKMAPSLLDRPYFAPAAGH